MFTTILHGIGIALFLLIVLSAILNIDKETKGNYVVALLVVGILVIAI